MTLQTSGEKWICLCLLHELFAVSYRSHSLEATSFICYNLRIDHCSTFHPLGWTWSPKKKKRKNAARTRVVFDIIKRRKTSIYRLNKLKSSTRVLQLLLFSPFQTEYEWSVSRRGVSFSLCSPYFFFFFLRFEKRGRKALWNLSKRCGLGWACMGASVPKNGNNRPLSLPLEKLFPQVSFLRCKGSQLLVSWIMSSAGCYRSKVRGRNKKKGGGMHEAGVRCEQ